MPPVLSRGGGSSGWLSVHWEPVSEWELSARTSCQQKKKLKIQNYTISLFWSKVFSQNLEILPNSQKFRLNSGSMCKNQPGCAQNSWNSAPPGKSGSPGREMQIFGELGFFLALQELSEFPCKMQPQVKAVLPAWLGQHKNAKQKFDFIILS